MKSTHHTFRVISVGIGLALLVVSGTAAMIATFSGPISAPSAYVPHAAAPAPASGVFHHGDDSLLYERVARSDGSTQWVLINEPAVSVASLMLSGERLQPINYVLQGKPSGLNKVLKNCNIGADNGTKPKAVDAYDLSCVTLG
ncbi:hypothetical protein [Polaromonas sp. A23]|uniref:hypothetical protein n=1 Tax=Polaromonas sp. A23 TaxID=1944133 RepID=UPI0009859226|nr:hypothetical protein [Polaromonas sp. A23]OOG39087.1 hypothetical protein B0B52_15865 [Polaromonas sp. A23]